MKIRAVSIGKATLALSALLFATAVLTCSAGAFDIKKGALVLRSGAVNTDASYRNEQTDANGKLHFVSALCSPTNNNRHHSAGLIATDTTRALTGLFAAVYGATQASTIIKAGGTVASKPILGNPNHCEIGGLTPAKLKGVWRMCTAAAGCP